MIKTSTVDKILASIKESHQSKIQKPEEKEKPKKKKMGIL